MRSYAELLWAGAQRARPGLFVADDRGPNLLEQAGAVRLFATIAGGASPPV
jgi:hypothetical protein